MSKFRFNPAFKFFFFSSTTRRRFFSFNTSFTAKFNTSTRRAVGRPFIFGLTSSQFAAQRHSRREMTTVNKSEEEWRAILSPQQGKSTLTTKLGLPFHATQFEILRQKGTERPGTGEYDKHYEQGVYACAGCGTPLYKSDTKFKIEQAARMINQAQRPIIYAGGGVLSSPMGPKFLKELAEQGNIPVCTTLQGLGAFDETSDKSLHMLGMHGSAYANIAMQKADVIIALGARFDDRVTLKVDKFAPAARAAAKEGRGGIIHFEIQPKNINKVVEAQIPILGDVVSNLSALVPLVKATPRKEWFESIRGWKEAYPFTYVKSAKGEKMKPQEIVEELDKQLADKKEDVIITTGVGQHQMWAAQHYRWKHPRSMVTSGGLGTMGFGLPAAVGAKVAAPNKVVVDIDGDASFSMTAMELATASQYSIGVKVLILNNEFQGMVLQWQDLFYEKRYSHTKMTNPDFVRLAQAMGVHAIRCTSAEDLPAKMKEFLEYDNSKPVVMECVVEKDEHVFPMVPAGKALHEQLLHPTIRDTYKY
ncbi:hypothetical protein NMY22_g14573 [Coprinellus aureogranulatus]|nr:hypothetical protein NMY22_g14573 [Coprinellus aureogranulatus]